MNKQKIMALLLTSVIISNQTPPLVNATTLEGNKNTIFEENENIIINNETNDILDNENTNDPENDKINESINSNKTNPNEEITGIPVETPVEEPSKPSLEIPIETPDESIDENTDVNDSDLVPYAAWEYNSYLIDEVTSKTGVSDINKITYGDLKKIKMLDLSYSISGLPKIISKFTSLVSLNAPLCISGSDYDNFFDVLSQLTSLEELDISNNNLSTIPESIANLVNLKALYLNGNKFYSIPNSILKLSNLKYLELSQCELNELPKDINNLSNLISLELSENYLSSLPTSISNMTSLRYLGFDKNNFSEFPTEVLKLESLEDLVLSNNNLVTLPDSISNMDGDKIPFTLNITNNQVYSSPEITNQNLICYNNFLDQSYYGFPYNAQLRLEENPLRLDVNEVISTERYREFVYVYKLLSPFYGTTQPLDERIKLDLMIDDKVVTPEDLSKLDEGVYTGKFKIQGSDINNKASETSETFKILVGNVDLEEDENKPDINIPENATGIVPIEYWEECTPLMAATFNALGGKDISEITFEDLATVETLILTNQDLNDLPQLLTKYTNLKSLNINDNKFRTIPKEIFELKSLEELSLANNGLTYISDKLNTLSNLSYLDLSYNVNIQESLDNVFNITSLTNLYLSGCNLYYISDKINNLTNLSNLVLSFNQLTSIKGSADSIVKIGNIFFVEDNFYKQLILKNNDITLSKENLTDKEYLNSLVEIKTIDTYNSTDLRDELNPGHTLEFIVNGNVVSGEELSKYPNGTYEATLKLQNADISNTCAITTDTVKIKIENNNNTTLNPNTPNKPSTDNSNGSKPNKLPQTGDMGSLGFLFTGLLSLAGGSSIINKKKLIKK